MSRKGYIVDSAPKLLNVKPQNQNEWKFECPYCSSKDLSLTPIGIEFIYTTHPDTSNLPLEYKKHLSRLPNVVDAVLASTDTLKGSEVLIACNKCGQTTSNFFNRNGSELELCYVDKNKLKKYLQSFYKIDDSFQV